MLSILTSCCAGVSTIFAFWLPLARDGARGSVFSTAAEGTRPSRLNYDVEAASPAIVQDVLPPIRAAYAPSVRPLRVLVVEDNPIVAQITQRLISTRAGALVGPATSVQVSLALNGREGYDAFLEAASSDSGPFDLIFMDLNMPLMMGDECTRLIRKWEAENDVAPGKMSPPRLQRSVIVMLSAHVMESEGGSDGAYGGVDWVEVKPVRAEKVIHGIREACSRRGEADSAPRSSAQCTAEKNL